MDVPVCDGEYGAAVELLPDGGLDEVVRLQVNGRRGLVQDEHLERIRGVMIPLFSGSESGSGIS